VSDVAAGVVYDVDIVFCIDVTGSMGPVIEKVKQGALSFHERLSSVLARRDITVTRTRIRVVAFRDFGADEYDVIRQTAFLELPEDAAEFESFMAALKATGGGDFPESGLEALALAVHSPWNRDPRVPAAQLRHFIVVFSDASAHPLGTHSPRPEQFGPRPQSSSSVQRPARWSLFSRRATPPVTVPAQSPPEPTPAEAAGLPEGFPQSLDDLQAQWGVSGRDDAVMDQDAKRLLVFAPDEQPWRDIAETWDKTMHVISTAGTGLAEVALDEVISTIARSA
jgi:hypothetical protein